MKSGKNKKSIFKWIALGTLIFFVGIIGGFLLSNYQHKKSEMKLIYGPIYNDFQLFSNLGGNNKNKFGKMLGVFDDFFCENRYDIDDIYYEDRADFKELYKEYLYLDKTDIDKRQQGKVRYVEKTNINGKKTSYELNGNRMQGNKSGTIEINGKNFKGNDFSFSGSLSDDGKGEGVIVDEKGNSSFLDFDNYDIKWKGICVILLMGLYLSMEI